MDININYYSILGVESSAEENQIKKAYYKLSFEFHPDKNAAADPVIFSQMTEAYNVLCSEQRQEYDKKSKWGRFYDEYYELFELNYEYDHTSHLTHLETFKKNEINNIILTVESDFNGTIEYERLVKCKSCDGTGKDTKSKIVIKDLEGNILKSFDSEDGCDFCEGTGKFEGFDCQFCFGRGKVGLNQCQTCKGEKRILGKQKITKIKLVGKETKLESMGHHSKNEAGKVGYLLIKQI
jgi:DnaJ-class molecular chaperone